MSEKRSDWAAWKDRRKRQVMSGSSAASAGSGSSYGRRSSLGRGPELHRNGEGALFFRKQHSPNHFTTYQIDGRGEALLRDEGIVEGNELPREWFNLLYEQRCLYTNRSGYLEPAYIPETTERLGRWIEPKHVDPAVRRADEAQTLHPVSVCDDPSLAELHQAVEELKRQTQELVLRRRIGDEVVIRIRETGDAIVVDMESSDDAGSACFDIEKVQNEQGLHSVRADNLLVFATPNLSLAFRSVWLQLGQMIELEAAPFLTVE